MVEIVTINEKKKEKNKAVHLALIITLIFNLVLAFSSWLFNLNYIIDTYLIISVITYHYWVDRLEKIY